VVENNRHAEPLPGEDLQGFEQDLPGENTAGFNTTTLYGLPIQICMTLNDHWGWSRHDRNTKSVQRLVHLLAKSASVGGNLLLNVGPNTRRRNSGAAPGAAARGRSLAGARTAQGSDGSRAGTLPLLAGCVCTRRGDRHFVHVLDNISDCVQLSGVPEPLQQARLVASNTLLEREPLPSDGLSLYLPPDRRDPHPTVIELF
jgi:alpha-L-fucosidase